MKAIYSGVVSLKGISRIISLGRLNELPVYATDIGNAYSEAKTQEKVYIIAGPEFGSLEGHTFVMNKVIYALHSPGIQWHEKLADSLIYCNKAEANIQMRKNGNLYEYIASYVDDLSTVAKEPMNQKRHRGTSLKQKGRFHITWVATTSRMMMVTQHTRHANISPNSSTILLQCFDTNPNNMHHHWKVVTTPSQTLHRNLRKMTSTNTNLRLVHYNGPY